MSAEQQLAATYLKKLASQVKRPIGWAFLLGSLKTLIVIIQLALLALLAQRIFVEQQTLVEQGSLLTALLLSSLLRGLLPLAQNHWLRLAAEQATHQARQRLLQRWQVETRKGATLSAADGALVLEPIDALKGYFSRYLVQRYLVLLSPLLVLLVCFYVNAVVGVLLLLAGPIIPLFMALIGIGAERLSQRHAQQTHALSRVFTDKLRHLTTLKLFNAGDAAIADVAKAGDDYRQATMSTLKIAFLSSAVLEFFASVAIAGVALYVGFGLLGYIDWLGADQLTLFSGLFVLLLAPEFFAPLRQFAQSYHDRAAAIGAASLLCRSGSQAAAQPPAVEALAPEVAYRWQQLSVSFSAASTLRYPDASIMRGQLTVIKGASGSGKSTLLRVLLQQQPYDGQCDIANDLASPQGIAYFAQQPYLQPTSLRNNLNAFENHTDEQLWQALRQVQLDTLVNQLPQQLDYTLAEQGRGLSGGEGRRLALARCILAQRPLIIADEPTENLDEVSAAAICCSLREQAQQGVTVIVASHDPALVDGADQVIEVGL